MTRPEGSEASTDFSLVLGGPLYQLLRRVGLSGDALEHLKRRMIILACFAWLPLLLLSAMGGNLFEGSSSIPFLHDVETHVRFLIALPMLIGAELVVHERLQPAVRQFVARRIVIDEELAKFRQAIASTLRMRNSVFAELALVVIVYAVGPLIWRDLIAQEVSSWYATSAGGEIRLTPAGFWLVFVALPIFQFILLRWYFRFFLWFWFLLRVAFLNLKLLPIHADRTGGIGFLGNTTLAFGPVLAAQGAVLAGMMASKIFFGGQVLTDFRVQIVAFLGFFVVATLVPLSVFAPQLARAKRRGLGEFGLFASQYGSDFREKWLQGRTRERSSENEELLGSGDIQSLADLGNSFSVVQEMRMLPFGWRDITRLAIITAAPFLPLLLTVFSLDDFAKYVIKAIF